MSEKAKVPYRGQRVRQAAVEGCVSSARFLFGCLGCCSVSLLILTMHVAGVKNNQQYLK